jgi:hypothetical protein
MDFGDALHAAGLSLSPTETALALQTLQGPKGCCSNRLQSHLSSA